MKYLLLAFLCSGCSLLAPCPVDGEAARLASDYRDARQDGTLDAADMRVLDSDVGYVEDALDEKGSGFSMPPTGIPWLDIALGVAGLAATGITTHKVTMKKRDKTRAEVLKQA